MTRLEGYLGLAKRANKLVVGDVLRDAALKRRLYLVIIALDISPRSRVQLEKCLESNTKVVTYQTKEQLGRICNSRPVGAIGITDQNLAAVIAKSIDS